MKEICRTCLKPTDNLIYLFNDAELSYKIETISSIKVDINDNFSSKICGQCERNIHLLYDFRSIIIRSDIILRGPQVVVKEEVAVDPNSSPTEYNFDKHTNDNTNIKCEKIYIESINVDIPESVESKPDYKCKECDFECSDYGVFRKHKRTHILCPKSICNICGKSVRADNLSKHIKNHDDTPIGCKICGKTCKNSESLRFHIRVHKKLSLQCNICGNTYSQKSSFREHQKRHALGDVKTVKCTLCDKMFYTKRFLAKHIRSHTGERPYPCEFCKKGFSSSYALKTHRRKHTNENPFACELCPMAFPQKVYLKTHMKSKHPDSTPPDTTNDKSYN